MLAAMKGDLREVKKMLDGSDRASESGFLRHWRRKRVVQRSSGLSLQNVNATDKNRMTALMYAAEHQPAAVQPLVDAKSDINATDNDVSILISRSVCV